VSAQLLFAGPTVRPGNKLYGFCSMNYLISPQSRKERKVKFSIYLPASQRQENKNSLRPGGEKFYTNKLAILRNRVLKVPKARLMVEAKNSNKSNW
jgi:hypothetical protein